MLEVRLFATLRENREKIYFFDEQLFNTVYDVYEYLGIQEDEVSTLLINGFHSKPETQIHDGDILALFPPVGGG